MAVAIEMTDRPDGTKLRHVFLTLDGGEPKCLHDMALVELRDAAELMAVMLSGMEKVSTADMALSYAETKGWRPPRRGPVAFGRATWQRFKVWVEPSNGH